MGRYLPYLMALIVLSGCGKKDDDDDAGPPFSGSFSGTESGTQDGTKFTQTVKFVLSQNGTAITGTWLSQSGSSGSVAGKAVGTVVDKVVIEDTAKCPGTLSGKMLLDGNKLSATLTGTLENCGEIAAAIDAVKN